MDLGLSLATFHGFTLEEALGVYQRLADRFDLTVVEINLETQPGPATQWPRDVPLERLREFARRFRHRGAHLPFRDLNPIASNTGIREESRRQLAEALEVAARMGMTYVVSHAPGGRAGVGWVEERPMWLEVFGDLGRRAAGEGVILCVENGERLVRLDRLLDVVETLDQDHVRICLDTGHAHERLWEPDRFLSRLLPRLDQRWRGAFRVPALMPYERYKSLPGFLRRAEPWIHHFHLHDRRGKVDHVGLGQGGIDLPSLVSYLSRRPVVLEIPLRSEEAFAGQIEAFCGLVDGAGGAR